MKKRYKRKRSGWMRRTSRIYLNNSVNKGKIERLKAFLTCFKNILNFCISFFWASHDTEDNNLPGQELTKRIEERYGGTAD